MRCAVPLSLVVIVALIAFAGTAGATVLYDGSSGTPGLQGWLYLTDPLAGALATETFGAGVTTLDTTPDLDDGQTPEDEDMDDKAGYFSSFHPSVPTMDRNTGYTVRFDVQVPTENHVNGDRSGFSLIALGHDSLGVELSFWEDEIWAKSDTFLHAEGQPWDTTAGLTQYELRVFGDDYSLWTGTQSILSGSLKDYSWFGVPYDQTDFLFLGDNTTTAEAILNLSYVEVTTGRPTPEPSTLVLAAIGGVGCLLWYGRRRRQDRSYSNCKRE